MTATAPPLVLAMPDVRCPQCGAPPRIRVPVDERDRYTREDDERVVLTYECHMRNCRLRYRITAGALRRAL